MKLKKVWAVMIAAMVMASMSACGDKKESDKKESSEETTTAAATEEKEEETTETTKAPASSTDSVKVYYGWGSTSDEAKYTAEIFCPEGAEFEENTLEDYEEDGSVVTVTVFDEVNEYRAVSYMITNLPPHKALMHWLQSYLTAVQL